MVGPGGHVAERTRAVSRALPASRERQVPPGGRPGTLLHVHGMERKGSPELHGACVSPVPVSESLSMSKQKTSTGVWLERAMAKSPALASLRTATAIRVLLVFLGKRQMAKAGRRGHERWTCVNNGDITFSYDEAERKYGITDGQFSRAINALRAAGFIDIEQSGAGLFKSQNTYSISERWRDYGTPDFKPPKERPRGPNNGRGFQPGNKLGRWAKEKSTVADKHGAMFTHEHGEAKTGDSHAHG